jgi:hypothetical protein
MCAHQITLNCLSGEAFCVRLNFKKMFAPTTPSFLSADFAARSLLRLTHQITHSVSQNMMANSVYVQFANLF